MSDNLRTKIIKIRCTQEEHDSLVARSNRPQLASWMRDTCLGVREKRERPTPPVDPQLLRQLSGLGNNLNQIARAVNSESYSALDRVQILSALSAIQRDLDSIMEAHHDREIL